MKSQELFKDYTLDDYTKKLSSSDPIPGGGGTSALVLALAISLGNMVGSLTVGKKKYLDVEDEIKECILKGEALRRSLLKMIDEDAEAFEPLSKAYGLPKDDPDRDRIMEGALRDAAFVPYQIIDNCEEALNLIEIFSEKGSKLAVSDAGCAAVLARSAVEAASLNVFINTKLMKDRVFAEAFNHRTLTKVKSLVQKADRIYQKVLDELK